MTGEFGKLGQRDTPMMPPAMHSGPLLPAAVAAPHHRNQIVNAPKARRRKNVGTKDDHADRQEAAYESRYDGYESTFTRRKCVCFCAGFATDVSADAT